MDLLKLYGTYICMFFKSRKEYKASFIAGIFANFYCYLITYITFWILTKKFTSIGGWDFSEVTILYGINLFTYAISGTLFWNTLYFLERMVTTGELDRYLVRPVGIIPQLMCQGFGYTFLGQILVTLIFLIIAFHHLIAGLTVLKVVYLILAIAGGIMLQSGAMILVGSLSFWLLRSTEIGQIVYYDIRNFVNYPLSIYPKLVKIILTFVFPWAFINYYPGVVFLGKAAGGTFEFISGLLAPIVGFLFLAVAVTLFKTGMKRYSSAGN